jgi:hypothetical protein
VKDRDVESVVKDIQSKLDKVKLPQDIILPMEVSLKIFRQQVRD